jgi:hypothetical protein
VVTTRHSTTMHALLETVQRKCFLYGLSLGYISRTIRQLALSVVI